MICPMPKRLSIVIPAHNEAHKIGADIRAGADFLTQQDLSGEIIVVDDASTDGTCEQARATSVPKEVDLNIITLAKNRGKGHAVKTGMLRSSGQTVMFADSGCCIPFETALAGMHLIQTQDCHIAIGSRRHQKSVIVKPQGRYRQLCSWVFNRIAILKFPALRHFHDTQCGFKVYQGDVARELFGDSVIDGFMFDIEILMRALQRGYRISDFPVEWTCDHDSRLSPSKHWKAVLHDMNCIKGQTMSTHSTH
jgi:dolichyl-phosphate beta-glucosyltransferase